MHVNTAHWTTSRLLTTAARLNDHHNNVRLMNMGITQSSTTTLRALADNGPMSQVRLADVLHVQAQTMGKVLEKLELKRLVSRVRDIRDGRSNRILITARGRALLTRIDGTTEDPATTLSLSDQVLRDHLIRIITDSDPAPA